VAVAPAAAPAAAATPAAGELEAETQATCACLTRYLIANMWSLRCILQVPT
jgi:hypothetical protein